MAVPWKGIKKEKAKNICSRAHLQSIFLLYFSDWKLNRHRQDYFTVWDKMHITLCRPAPAIRGLISSGILIQYWILQTFDNVFCKLKFHFSISPSSAPPEGEYLQTGRIWTDKAITKTQYHNKVTHLFQNENGKHRLLFTKMQQH